MPFVVLAKNSATFPSQCYRLNFKKPKHVEQDGGRARQTDFVKRRLAHLVRMLRVGPAPSWNCACMRAHGRDYVTCQKSSVYDVRLPPLSAYYDSV